MTQRIRLVGATVAAFAALAGCGTTGTPVRGDPAAASTPTSATDVFGTTAIYPSATGAREWHARWSANPRVLHDGEVDPYDPEFDMRGSSQTLEIRGDGTAKSSGDVIRMYVGDPTRARRWLNVELTVYGKRVAEAPSADGAVGFEFQARTDDGHSSSSALDAAGLPVQCDGKAYGFSFRADGRGLFEKELKHPVYTDPVSANVWGGGAFPKNQWIGMKMIVYSVDGGAHVKQELWRDLTDGANGGTWEKVLEHTDAGGWSVDAATAASCGIPPDFVITAPQPLVILRNDSITEQWYKKASIREIRP